MAADEEPDPMAGDPMEVQPLAEQAAELDDDSAAEQDELIGMDDTSSSSEEDELEEEQIEAHDNEDEE